jgi:hypothetical protein
MDNREKDKNTSADLSKKPEGGSMRNRDDKGMTNVDRSSGSEIKESTRRPGSSYDSSTGRSGSSGNKSSGSDRLRDENDISRDSERSGKSDSMDNPPKDRHF